MGIRSAIERLTSGLTKTRESLVVGIQRLVRSKKTVDEEFLTDLEQVLLAADLGVQTTERILRAFQERVREQGYESADELMALVKKELEDALQLSDSHRFEGFQVPDTPRPFVIMVVGVNGAGKTTTVGKLAYRFSEAGHSVVIGAADTFRAAANEQLQVWAERANVPLIQQHQGADPGSVAFDTLSSAIARKADVVVIDTAGRLHTKVNLMEELGKISRVLNKRMPGAPHEVLLVLDGSTGQNAIQQAKEFTQAVKVSGLVITKLDGTAKGGAVVAISDQMKIPVRFIGVGEQLEDLQPFDSRTFVEALFEKREEPKVAL
ncbi:MAG TPA: signal recognition particle-docking protein FtsY [Bacteroidota bacterium]|nr:signal recognition particle-docking protein FtsY [Bacteroidota bacterium]